MHVKDAGVLDALEPRVREIGGELIANARRLGGGMKLSTRVTEWAIADPSLKVQLFRFIDAFPMLKTPVEVHSHLEEYLSLVEGDLPLSFGLGLKAGRFMKGSMSKVMTSQVRSTAQRFIGAEDVSGVLPSLERRWRDGVAATIDLLGEKCYSDAEADRYQQRYLEAVGLLAQASKRWKGNDRLELDHLGSIPRANLSIKVSSMAGKADALDYEDSLKRMSRMLTPIIERAAEQGVFLNFDIEDHSMKDLTIDLFMHVCEEHDFHAGIALQAYLRSGERDTQRLIQWARKTGRQVTVRLVKGGYWDYELAHSADMGWPCPVWTDKRDTDACFERMARQFVASTPRGSGEGGVKLAIGSHNARSIATVLAEAEAAGLPETAVEVQMLYGMAEGMKQATLARGLRLREYIPVGPLIPGMAYLVRRLLENTSNESWLIAGDRKDITAEQLLVSPHRMQRTVGTQHGPNHDDHSKPGVFRRSGDECTFRNEPFRDFADSNARSQFTQAVMDTRLPNPPRDVNSEQLDAAIATAAKYSPQWRDVPHGKRADVLKTAAKLMLERRDRLSALVVAEAAKPWHDADAEVCEAIDFCEYYARQAGSLFTPAKLGSYMGEIDEMWYKPCGVTAVISPWNFPIAICMGMTVAALVTGNTVLVKPAEQTPRIAEMICELLWEAGAPRQALQLVPGPGHVIGAQLVRDPRVALIAFTGSKAVGLDIIRAASDTPAGQDHIKKIVCEMGGKNAIIVDSSADLDEAVVGVRYSAFGYSGQKCSACSRLILLDGIYDRFLTMLTEATQSLVVGDAKHPGTDVGPVIDDEAAMKVRSYVQHGKDQHRLVLGMETPAGIAPDVSSRLIGPHIFAEVEPGDALAQEEVFGPVLAVLRATDFDHAIDIANQSPYKLTGGLFSRTPSHLRLARQALDVGNLYLNRGITGAMVARQPFGGYGMSGVGSKAGGPDYLLQFVEPRCCSENIMRQGFSPEIEAIG